MSELADVTFDLDVPPGVSPNTRRKFIFLHQYLPGPKTGTADRVRRKEKSEGLGPAALPCPEDSHELKIKDKACPVESREACL